MPFTRTPEQIAALEAEEEYVALIKGFRDNHLAAFLSEDLVKDSETILSAADPKFATMFTVALSTAFLRGFATGIEAIATHSSQEPR